MTLETKIIALAEAVGADVKGLKSATGDLTSLSTAAKNNLVAAINELFSAVGNALTVNDSAGNGATTVTWSADKIYDSLALKAALASPAFTGTPTAPTASIGNSGTQIATTAFVQRAVGGFLSKSVTGGTVTLNAGEASNVAIGLKGALTSNLSLIVPTAVPRAWIIHNGTSGAHSVTVKTASGAGVEIAQGKRAFIYTDGVDVFTALDGLDSAALTGSPTAPTPAAGDNDTSIATTAFVQGELTGKQGDAAPLMDGTAAAGTDTKFAREDHRHPTDISRAPLASPTFTGSPKAPTAATGTNTTQIATTAFVQAAVAALVDGAAGTLDTLNELAAALGNDPNFAATIATGLSNRVRFDAAQSLSAAQRLQACTNLGVGDPEHDFVADYTTAKA